MRVFEVLTPSGWTATNANKILREDHFRVLDAGVPQNLAPELPSDPGIYIATGQVQEGVFFVIRPPGETPREKVAAFTA